MSTIVTNNAGGNGVVGGQTGTLAEGSKNKRRRYFSTGRSRTIELSTLAEIDEEEFARAESSLSQASRAMTTKDDMCIGTGTGTYKSIKRGSVKAQAMKLSERLAQKVAAEKAAMEKESSEERFSGQKASCSVQPRPVVADVKVRRNLTEIRRVNPMSYEPTELNAQGIEWAPHHQQHQHHEFQPSCSVQTRHPLSRSASFVTPAPVFVYSMPAPPASQPTDRLSMIDSRCESRVNAGSSAGDYSLPTAVYYMPPPPPTPMFVPFVPNSKGGVPFDGMMMMAHPSQYTPQINYDMGLTRSQKMLQNHMSSRRKSWCSRICCAGLAQMLWTIVCIISFGIIASLILALCYM